MAARTLQQIVSELSSTFDPQVKSLQSQQQLIPQEIASQEQALNAQKDVAYDDIVSGARRRGLGFSGIPLGEQAKYAATTYAPALAGLRQQGQQKAMGLQDAILGINERRDTLAQSIYQTEQDRAETARANAASAAASASPTLGSLQSILGGGQTAAPRVEGTGGNYKFFSASGQPITAGQYASETGQDIRDVLYTIGSGGNKVAADIYNKLRTIQEPRQFETAIQYFTQRYPYVFSGYQAPRTTDFGRIA